MASMSPERIVTGQPVAPAKVERSRDLRRRMTPAERRLWAQLRGRRLDGARFRRQLVVAGFILDFYCHAAGLAVEVDGGVHETQQAYDLERDHALAAQGVRVRRLANDQVLGDLPAALALVRTWLRGE
jgi:very-short-patch-repair endonuclease